MTKYQCHGCGKIYDDEDVIPVRCCGKVLRHIFEPDLDDVIEEMAEEKMETIEATMYAVNCSKEQAQVILDEIERQKNILIHDVLSDLIMYSNHLKANYQIGTHSPFHMLVGRIENRMNKKQDVKEELDEVKND